MQTHINSNVPIFILHNDYDVDAGDTVTLVSVNPPTHGRITLNGSTVIYAPATDFVGVERFEYTIRDQAGATTVGRITVVVGQGGLAFDDRVTIDEDTVATLDVLANDRQQVDRPLTIQAIGAPQHGIARRVDNQLVYTPSLNFHGVDRFLYIVFDGKTVDSAVVTVTVRPINDAPQANDDRAVTHENVPITIPVLANDSDIEDDTLLLTAVSLAQHGTAVISNNQIVYQPTADYTGLDRFVYSVADGPATRPDRLVSTATVIIQIKAADAPIARTDLYTVRQGEIVTLELLLNDSDPNQFPLVIQTIGSPNRGQAVISGSTVVYTAPIDYLGPDGFDYTISNGGLSNSGLVSLQIVSNTAPIAVDDVVTGVQNVANLVEVLRNDYDPDGDPLLISQVSQPVNGTAIISGQQIIYTPEAGFLSTDSFIYIISDGLLTDTGQVFITVEPLALNIQLITPTQSSLVENARPFFDWSDGLSRHQILTYTLMITSQTDGSSRPALSLTIPIRTSSYTMTFDLPDGEYHWTVIAYDSTGPISRPPKPERFIIKTEKVWYLPLIER